jgi:hypothetical protein
MTTAANRDQKFVFPSKSHASDHVSGACATRDQCGALADQAVPDFPDGIVVRIIDCYENTPKLRSELVSHCAIEHALSAAYGHDPSVDHENSSPLWLSGSAKVSAISVIVGGSRIVAANFVYQPS